MAVFLRRRPTNIKHLLTGNQLAILSNRRIHQPAHIGFVKVLLELHRTQFDLHEPRLLGYIAALEVLAEGVACEVSSSFLFHFPDELDEGGEEVGVEDALEVDFPQQLYTSSSDAARSCFECDHGYAGYEVCA